MLLYRKLQSARERLAKLQSLVSMVQQWPETAEVLPEDLAELAATAMDDTVSEASTISMLLCPIICVPYISNVYSSSRFLCIYGVLAQHKLLLLFILRYLFGSLWVYVRWLLH